ncbi:MAG: type II secretion system GspH family protein, partial [Gemmataceae bacterium]|nr:type II secretion system GspH family protein [Gemmataceae bacterium]
ELLVAIAIIGILASLASVAVFRWIDRQRVNNTNALLQTVQECLKRHWTKVIEDAKKEAIPSDVVTLAGGSQDRARVIWIKLRLTEAFPTSYYEILYPPQFYDHNNVLGKGKTWVPLIPPDRQHYSKMYRDKLTVTGPKPTDRLTESAACLALALSVNRGGAAPLDLDALPIPLADTDGGEGDGVKELVDAWGNPLAFLRFPTTNDKTPIIPPGVPAANPGLTTPPFLLQPYDPSGFDSYGQKNGDPLDPRPLVTDKSNKKAYLPGQLTHGAWWSSNARVIVQEVCRFSLVDPASGNQPWSFYTLPIVASRGPDRVWGVKVIEDNVPAGAPSAAPPNPRPTWRALGDYADMRALPSPGPDPYQTARDNLYSHMLGAPQ